MPCAAARWEGAPASSQVGIDLASVFAADGPLARALPAYRFRTQQLAMAEAVAQAIAERSPLLAEAGTGTGKTFAYVVPALLSGGKVIVSTGTKTLQDQLFARDLPLVRDALKVPLTVALLKGRANYVCHYHLGRARQADSFTSRADAGYLGRIESFARTSKSGDKAELTTVPDTATIWAQVTSTRDNCLGGVAAPRRWPGQARADIDLFNWNQPPSR